jgi:serine phosphatase RsbU (regulator of sigma subunit)/anti-sigma regulatory factor (Ser/Thr protein kinase)
MRAFRRWDVTLSCVADPSSSAGVDGQRAVDADPDCHYLDAAPDAVRVGRRFVVERVRHHGAPDLSDDAALIAAELLANAVQHGLPPVSVCVRRTGDRLRISVVDASPRSPVRPVPSTENMTGRGLALVEALTTRWGVERDDAGGKTVWCELPTSGVQVAAATGSGSIDQLLADWQDDAPTAEERYTVVLGDVPTSLLLEAKAHIDNLVREFSLVAATWDGEPGETPAHLARLIATVVHGFADARVAIKRQALVASQRGEPRTRLTLHLPLSAADAGVAYLAALDEADEYARAVRLLTLETPPEHRLFRHWYVEALIDQLRDIAAGRTPPPVPPFEQCLVAEVHRLSEAQRVNDRAARLQRVTAALARATTPEDVAAVVVSEGVAALGASGGGLLVPAADGDHLSVPGVVGYGEGLVGILRAERIDAPLPAATALRTGEAIWLESQEERDRRFPELRGFEASTISMCAVPLIVGDHSLGALRFSFDARKLFDDEERAFVQALAAITASTLQRTEIYEAERQAALELQRALLPEEVITAPGWDVAAYYSPAGEQEAGGDFYDVIPLDGGRIAAIVGDVMGRGVQAAAAMAQIRATIRAYALDNSQPVDVFSRVDRFFESLEVGQLVTAVYLLVDADRDSVQIANAGHVPPILVTPGGSRIVETEPGLPFGVMRDDRRASAVTLPSGAALVLVTDGLVERRGEDIDEGVARVLAATKNAAGLSARQLLFRVVQAAADRGTHDDDVTVLVLLRL